VIGSVPRDLESMNGNGWHSLNPLDSPRQVPPRVLGLSGSDSDDLSSDIGESGLREHGPETQKLSLSTRDPGVLNQRTGVLPILESDDFTIGSTSGGQDDSQQDQPGDGQYLDGSEPELALPIDTRAGKVDGEDDDETDGDPDGVADLLRRDPVVDQDGRGGEFGRENDRPVVPTTRRAKDQYTRSKAGRLRRARKQNSLVPTQSETHGRIDETFRKSDVSTRNRQVSHDFS
jgi:hypothetical protein